MTAPQLGDDTCLMAQEVVVEFEDVLTWWCRVEVVLDAMPVLGGGPLSSPGSSDSLLGCGFESRHTFGEAKEALQSKGQVSRVAGSGILRLSVSVLIPLHPVVAWDPDQADGEGLLLVLEAGEASVEQFNDLLAGSGASGCSCLDGRLVVEEDVGTGDARFCLDDVEGQDQTPEFPFEDSVLSVRA